MVTLAAFGFFGCDNDDDIIYIEDPAPQAPQGVFSVTGDAAVYIFWNGLYEDDIVEYVVGWNDELLGEYEEVGRVFANPHPVDNLYGFVDTDVDNGQTYFYAVWAVDEAGQVSEPSLEEVFDTPRPEGTVELRSRFKEPILSGFDLSQGARVPWDASTADVYVDHDTLFRGAETLIVINLNAAGLATDIQDMGYHESFDEIGWAPDDGWSDLRKYELIAGHTYVVWTSDYHYAKMRVTALAHETGWVSFQWAYQTADTTNPYGNRELIGPPPDIDKRDGPVNLDNAEGIIPQQ